MDTDILPKSEDVHHSYIFRAKRLFEKIKAFAFGLVIRFPSVVVFYETMIKQQERTLRWLKRHLKRYLKTNLQDPLAKTQAVSNLYSFPANEFTVEELLSNSGKTIPFNNFVHESPLAIVLINRGDSEHLRLSLAMAKRHNPSSTVYLLGDDSNSYYKFVEHHPFGNYFSQASEFSKVYRHFSTNDHDYELFCFQRWFVLREFLVAKKLNECVYIDSDILLFANVTEERKKFARFDFTLAHMASGHTFFLNRVDALGKFCDFVMAMYSGRDSYHYDRMVAHYLVRRKNGLPGGVCDMTALQLYLLDNCEKIGEVGNVIDGSVYDLSIRSPLPGFEMDGNVKRITWIDGKPHGTLASSGELVRFNSLHFQGGAKELMQHFASHVFDESRTIGATPHGPSAIAGTGSLTHLQSA